MEPSEQGTGLGVLHGLISFGCFVGWHEEGRAGRERGQWGHEGQLCPHSRTLLGQPRTCLPKTSLSPGLGGDTKHGEEVALGCQSVFGVSSQSPCALSLQSLPRESDGKPREGQLRREDDSHGSQPVSTPLLLLSPLLPVLFPWPLSLGTLLFAPITPTPLQRLRSPWMGWKTPSRTRQRQGPGAASFGNVLSGAAWGFWGVSPSQICFFQRGMHCFGLCQPFGPLQGELCWIWGQGGEQSQESCGGCRAFAAPRSVRKMGLDLNCCILPPARLGRLLAAPGRGGNAPGIKLETHKFYWGWSNVRSHLGDPEGVFIPGWGVGDAGRRMLWGQKGCLV